MQTTPTAFQPHDVVLGTARTAMSVLGNVLTVALTVLAIVTLALAIASRLAPSDEFTFFGHPALVVLSGSMTPVIDTGDFIVDTPDPAASNLHVGQIASFYESNSHQTVVTHRIVAVVHRLGQVWYRTKGDANAAPDVDLRPAANVVGLYDFKIPRGGYVLTNMHKPLIIGLLLAAPLLWLASTALRGSATKGTQAVAATEETK